MFHDEKMLTKRKVESWTDLSKKKSIWTQYCLILFTTDVYRKDFSTLSMSPIKQYGIAPS